MFFLGFILGLGVGLGLGIDFLQGVGDEGLGVAGFEGRCFLDIIFI